MGGLEEYDTEAIHAELQRRYDCLNKPEGNYIIMGPPGSGKGTQSIALKQSHCYCHLSTGDILRVAANSGDPVGLKAKSYMDKGQLVPDDVVIKLIESNIGHQKCQRGFVLDGFPRTEGQANGLKNMMAAVGKKLHGVLLFDCPDSTIEERITGRLVHVPSGRVYHRAFRPPKVAMKDDVTGEPLIQRKDDTRDAIRTRLSEYHRQTTPLINYYSDQGLLHRFDSSRPEKDVKADVDNLIKKTGNKPGAG